MANLVTLEICLGISRIHNSEVDLAFYVFNHWNIEKGIDEPDEEE